MEKTVFVYSRSEMKYDADVYSRAFTSDTAS